MHNDKILLDIKRSLVDISQSLYNLSLEQILNYLQFTHDQRDGNCFGNFYYTTYLDIKNPYKHFYALGQVPVPQIEIQIDQMKRIISTFEKS